MLYDQQVVLSSLNRYMLRILLSYSISGQLPEGWSVQEIEDYLRSNRLSIHLAVFCFDAPIHSESARHAVQSDLLSRLCVCAKAYNSHIICMASCPPTALPRRAPRCASSCSAALAPWACA